MSQSQNESPTLYQWAQIAEHFHVMPEQIKKLTAFQRNKVLFFPRKLKTGELDIDKVAIPEPEPIEETTITPPVKSRKKEHFEAYQALFNYRNLKMISEENFQDSVAKLREKYIDIFDEEVKQQPKETPPEMTQEESEKVLYGYYVNGMLSEENYQEALAKIRYPGAAGPAPIP